MEFDPHSLLNTFIDNRSIQLVSVLGVGAYGIVYLGVHVPTSRRYAVKLITKQEAAENEVALHSKVSSHAGILTLEKVVREDGRIYLVLEYASGGDLFTAITQQQGFAGNNRIIRHIFLQIIDAVQHCHSNGISHRDLKPENVLIFPNMHVKLADFGLATTQTVSAEFGCGSSFYFSPECQGQLVKNNERVKGYSTQQNDVWSLGVILVNLAVGRNPWKQATMKDPAFAAYTRKPRGFFKSILPSISDELGQLLPQIFCLDPARRISLPELRLKVTCIKSFTCIQNDQRPCYAVRVPIKVATPTIVSTPRASPMKYTDSLIQTLFQYVQGFGDDVILEHQSTRPSYYQQPPPTGCLPPTPPSLPPPSSTTTSCSASPCSSVSSFGSIAETPRSPVIAPSPLDLKKMDAAIITPPDIPSSTADGFFRPSRYRCHQ